MARGWLVVASVAIVLSTLLAGRPLASAADAWECAPPSAPSPDAPVTIAMPTTPATFPDDGGELTIFAAASLTDPFDEMKATLEADHPELSITLSFAGSQTLVTQAVEGAPVDVLALAAVEPVDRAIDEGIVAGGPVIFARNALTVVVPADNPAGIDSPVDLADDDLRIVLAGPDVPAGDYARQSVCLMAGDMATYGDDFVGRVAANVVSEEDDVKSVLAKVALGEADAGIVYASDATDDVAAITIPEEVNVTASYPIAAVEGGNAELAAAFISYVLSAKGQAILVSYGFTPAV